MTNWYSTIYKDISRLPDAIDYYEKELAVASKECDIHGTIENMSKMLPSIVELRFNQLQETEAILRYLNIKYDEEYHNAYKKYLMNYNKTLKSTEADKFAKGDASVVSMAHIVNEFSKIRNKYTGIIKALDTKQWQLTNIIKLRVAGLDDASIE
jgi:hypothetical protein